jgi:hypothetical protein
MAQREILQLIEQATDKPPEIFRRPGLISWAKHLASAQDSRYQAAF